MELCDSGHEQVCHESTDCPACGEREAAEERVNDATVHLKKIRETVHKLRGYFGLNEEFKSSFSSEADRTGNDIGHDLAIIDNRLDRIEEDLET